MGWYSLFISLVGLIYQCFTGFSIFHEIDSLVVWLAVGYSVIVTFSTILCIVAAPHGSLAVFNMFATLGQVVISTVYGVIFDSENNTIGLWNGLGLGLVFIILFLSLLEAQNEKQKQTGHNKKMFIILCFLIFFVNGGALVVYSLLTKHRPNYGGVDFIVLYSCLCFLFCALAFGLYCVKREKRLQTKSVLKNSLNKISIGCIAFYSLVFILSEWCALYVTSLLPIVIQAPLSFVAGLVIVLLFDWIFYKEKISKINFIQSILSVGCVILFGL